LVATIFERAIITSLRKVTLTDYTSEVHQVGFFPLLVGVVQEKIEMSGGGAFAGRTW
jgi:hypothetical protein